MLATARRPIGGRAMDAANRIAGMGNARRDVRHGRRQPRRPGDDGEATAAAYRHFDMADANRDGQITREERQQLHQRMRGAKTNG